MSIKSSTVLIVATLALVLPLAGCGGARASQGAEGDQAKESIVADKKTSDYDVTIDSCTTATDYAGDPCVLVTFTFTNNSDKPQSMGVATNVDVYQNGVECSPAISPDAHSADLLNKVKPGGSISVTSAYSTTDSSDVEVDVYETFSLDKTPIASQTFSLS